MEFFQKAMDPWNREILVRASWDWLWVMLGLSAFGLLIHQVLRRRWIGKEAKVAATTGPEEKVARHSLASRLFHWTMAASMFVLLFTGFLPVVGIKFSWLALHWQAGIVLIASVVFHVLHVLVRRSLLQVWVGPRDIVDWIRGTMRALTGVGVKPRKPGKYPVENKLFHHAAVVTSAGVIVTGVLMMYRIETPFLARDPYRFSEANWGVIYIVHGFAGIGLVGLIVAHVYFAILPEKRWITRSMIFGWISKSDYETHHDPARWKTPGGRSGDDAGGREGSRK